MNKLIKLLLKVTKILLYPILVVVAIEGLRVEAIEDERLERISRSDL